VNGAADAPRYAGSLTECHGTVLAVHECLCRECMAVGFAADRLAITVRADDDGRAYHLEHVRQSSIVDR